MRNEPAQTPFEVLVEKQSGPVGLRWYRTLKRYGWDTEKGFKVEDIPAEVLAKASDEFGVAELVAASELIAPYVKESKLLPDDTPASLAERLTAANREPYKPAKHHKYLSDAYMRAITDTPGYLMVSMPPQHGKTLLLCWSIIWAWMKWPEKRILFGSYNDDRVEDVSYQLRQMINQYGPDIGLQIDPKRTAVDSWAITSGGIIKFVGLKSGGAGYSADICIIDDPFKDAEEANSEAIRKQRYNTYASVFLTRQSPNFTMILVQTRWHKADLCGQLEAEARTGEGLPYQIVNIPAEAGENDPLGREPGEWLWPERYSSEAYQSWKNQKSAWVWRALYQGKPTSDEGEVVKRSDFRFYTELPDSFDQIIQSWDPTFKDKQTSDRVAGQVWARKGPNFYCLAGMAKRLDFGASEAAILDWAVRFKGIQATLIEDSALGPALENTLRRIIPGVLLRPTRGKDKRTRLLAVEPAVRAHNVFLPANKDGVSPMWVLDMIEEICDFPAGTFDDQVDAFTQAISFLMPSGWRAEDKNVVGPELFKDLRTVQAESRQRWLKDVLKKDEKKRNPRRAWNAKRMW